MDIGSRIKEAAKLIGGQRSLSRRIDVSERTISDYVAGKSSPQVATLELIAEVTGVDVTWLITGKESETQNFSDDEYAGVIRRIRERLGFLGLSHSEAERLSQFPDGFVSEILSGKRTEYRTEKLRNLASALQCNSTWLLTGDGDHDAQEPNSIEEGAVWRAVKEVAEQPGVTPHDPEQLADLIVNLALHLQSQQDADDFGKVVKFGARSLKRTAR